MKQTEKAVALALARDCIAYKLSYEVGRRYIADRLPKNKDGKPRTISDTTYWRFCKQAEKDPQNQQWLMDHTKDGFVRVHREQMSMIETIQTDLMRMYVEEMQRPEKMTKEQKKLGMRARSLMVLGFCVGSIRENSKRLQELNDGTPTIQNIRTVVEVMMKEAKAGKLSNEALQELARAVGIGQE